MLPWQRKWGRRVEFQTNFPWCLTATTEAEMKQMDRTRSFFVSHVKESALNNSSALDSNVTPMARERGLLVGFGNDFPNFRTLKQCDQSANITQSLIQLTWFYSHQIGAFIISDFEICCSAMCCHIIYQPASQTPLQKYFYVHGFNLVKTYPCREEKKTLPDQDLTTIMNPWLRSTFLVQQHSLIRLVAGIGCWRKKKKVQKNLMVNDYLP